MRALFAGVGETARKVAPCVEAKRAYDQLNPSDEHDGAGAAEPAMAAERRAGELKRRLQRIRQSLASREVISFGKRGEEAFVCRTGAALTAFPWTPPQDEGAPAPPAEDFDLDSARF